MYIYICVNIHIYMYIQIYTPYICYVYAHFCGLCTKSLRVTELKVYLMALDRFESSGYKGTVLKQFANLEG